MTNTMVLSGGRWSILDYEFGLIEGVNGDLAMAALVREFERLASIAGSRAEWDCYSGHVFIDCSDTNTWHNDYETLLETIGELIVQGDFDHETR